MSEETSTGGVRRVLSDQRLILDGLCGRVSCLGLGDPAIKHAIQQAAEHGLGDAGQRIDTLGSDALGSDALGGDLRDGEPEFGNSWVDPPLAEQLWRSWTNLLRHHLPSPITLQRLTVCGSADEALERAIWTIRCHGEPNRFRTIAMTGSDHGRTTLCRTLSGRPEWQAGFGPLVPGVRHVPAGDIDALAAAIDDNVACVLLSPIAWSDDAVPLEASFLSSVRELCDRHDLVLVIDESLTGFGSTDQGFAFSAIADVAADAMVASAGLFAGMTGGVLLAGDRFPATSESETSANPSSDSVSLSTSQADEAARPDVAFRAADSVTLRPGTLLQAKILAATLDAYGQRVGSTTTGQAAARFASALAERIGGYEFVRDMNVLGWNLGIVTDIPAADLVAAASTHDLCIEACGDTAVRLQLPPVVSEADQEETIDRLVATCQTLQRQPLEL